MSARPLIVALCAMLAAACAQSARELPPNLGHLAPDARLQPGDRDDPAFALSCPDIDAAVADARQARAQHEARVVEMRSRDQAVVFLIGAPALLAQPHAGAHEAIRTIDDRLDRLDRIRVAKRCAAR